MEKEITGYDGLYKISDDAVITSIKTGKEIKQRVSSNGYKVVDLYKNNQRKTVCVHRIYATEFIPNPNDYPIVLHKDNDKLHISMDNLEWNTYSENNRQAIQDKLNKIPDNRKEYIISDGNGNNVMSMSWLGKKSVVKTIGNTTIGKCNRLIYKHDQIKEEGQLKGFYVEVVQ